MAQRLLQWLAVVLAAMLLCGVLDYALRLPGFIRLLTGLTIVGLSSAWFVDRMYRAVRFSPRLGMLALRVERLFPEMAGKLACGVELAIDANDQAVSPNTASLVDLSVRRMGRLLDGITLRKLINPRSVVRSLVIAALMSGVVAGVVLTAPQASALAARRWLAPLGDARWPRHTEIRSLVTEDHWPADTPLPLRAAVDRGFYPGMRAWATYRVIWPGGRVSAWQSILMSEQKALAPDRDDQTGAAVPELEVKDLPLGLFEVLIDPEEFRGDALDEAPGVIEFIFEAGDDQTPVETLELVARPEVSQVVVKIEPPLYADGLVGSHELRLDQESGQLVTATGLVGSRIEFSVLFSRSVPVPKTGLDPFLPGFTQHESIEIQPRVSHTGGAIGIDSRFVLNRTVETTALITDEHGLSNLSDRRYRIEAVADQLPVVSLLQPQSDETALPTARVELDAVSQDDIAMESLRLEALVTRGRSPAVDLPSEPPPSVVLDQKTGRQSQLNLGYELDLQPMAVEPGQEVVLTAVGQDIYERDGIRHDPVTSRPRRLRIIDESDFLTEVRNVLAGIRQRAAVLDDQQHKTMDQPEQQAGFSQQRLSRRLGSQADRMTDLRQRMARNRYEDPALNGLAERAKRLLDQAVAASQTADQLFLRQFPQDSQPQSRQAAVLENQSKVRDALAQLMKLLDQGKDALALQSQLQQLHVQQQSLAQDIRQLLPKTLGQSRDQLDPDTRRLLDEQAQRQADLAKDARDLLRSMDRVAEALSRQDTNPDDQALAAALAQAASIGRQQELSLNMKLGADKIGDNQLSSASQDQQSAMDAMRQMLQELDDLDEHRQAVLRRQLMKLEQAIRQLLDQQRRHRDRLLEANRVDELETGLTTLHRNTLALAEKSAADPKTRRVAQSLDQAGSSQSQAIAAVRRSDRDSAAQAEQQAIHHLEEALKQVMETRREAEARQNAQQRDELRKRYEELARQQEALQKETVGQLDKEDRSRRWRIEMIDLGHRQEDIRIGAGKLRNEVGPSLVFSHLHRQIDQTVASIVSKLRAGEPTLSTTTDQTAVVSMLSSMAKVLEQESGNDQEFAGGGGGSGGGGGGAPPLVPPLAELKLLREMQDTIYQSTRAFEAAVDTAGLAVSGQQTLEKLSTQQRELAELGRHMIEQMSSQLTPPPPPSGPSP